MLNLDHFIEDCRTAISQDPTHKAGAEVVEHANSRPEDVIAALGEPTGGGLHPIYVGKDITILNVVWNAGMTIMPHNHDMWAVISIYGGREDNIFWRRIKDHPEGKVEAAGAKSISTGHTCKLGRNIIHSVTNPLGRLTGAIHVYGGDFFHAHQSEWEPEGLTEQTRDMEEVRARFKLD